MSDDVVERLLVLAQGGDADLADDAVPSDAAAALALQLAVLDRRERAGEQVAGWKLAFTAGPARRLRDGQLTAFGHILRSRVFANGSELELARIAGCVVEPELCVTLGSPLAGPDVSAAQARAAVASVAPSFELNAVRLPGRPLPLAMADNLAQWGIVVGEDRPVAELDLDRLRVTVDEDGEPVADQAAAGHLDDPWWSLAGLSAALDRFGRSLAAGQRVLTGAFSVHEVRRPGRWTADFGALGSVVVTLS